MKRYPEFVAIMMAAIKLMHPRIPMQRCEAIAEYFPGYAREQAGEDVSDMLAMLMAEPLPYIPLVLRASNQLAFLATYEKLWPIVAGELNRVTKHVCDDCIRKAVRGIMEGVSGLCDFETTDWSRVRLENTKLNGEHDAAVLNWTIPNQVFVADPTHEAPLRVQ